jgi:hypothetical protein
MRDFGYRDRKLAPGVQLIRSPNEVGNPRSYSYLLYLGRRRPRWPFLILGLHHDSISSRRHEAIGVEITFYPPITRNMAGGTLRLRTPAIRGRSVQASLELRIGTQALYVWWDTDTHWPDYRLTLRERLAEFRERRAGAER